MQLQNKRARRTAGGTGLGHKICRQRYQTLVRSSLGKRRGRGDGESGGGGGAGAGGGGELSFDMPPSTTLKAAAAAAAGRKRATSRPSSVAAHSGQAAPALRPSYSCVKICRVRWRELVAWLTVDRHVGTTVRNRWSLENR